MMMTFKSIPALLILSFLTPASFAVTPRECGDAYAQAARTEVGGKRNFKSLILATGPLYLGYMVTTNQGNWVRYLAGGVWTLGNMVSLEFSDWQHRANATFYYQIDRAIADVEQGVDGPALQVMANYVNAMLYPKNEKQLNATVAQAMIDASVLDQIRENLKHQLVTSFQMADVIKLLLAEQVMCTAKGEPRDVTAWFSFVLAALGSSR